MEIAAVEVKESTIFDADEFQSRTQEFFANRRRFAGFDVDTDHLERGVMVVGQQEFEHYVANVVEIHAMSCTPCVSKIFAMEARVTRFDPCCEEKQAAK
jgi:hypothetical protein